MMAIEAAGLAQRFGDRVVVGPLDISLPEGGSLAVLGENGSGKSTLLRMLATLTRPAAGRLAIFGLDAAVERSALRGRLGYVPDRAGHYPALTALENLEFFCDLHGVPRARAEQAIEMVGLAASRGRRAAELSRGMGQRLALARALLHAPSLLILDEPEGGLDERGRELLQALGRGRTLVIATHDRELAGRLCGQALELGSRPLLALR